MNSIKKVLNFNEEEVIKNKNSPLIFQNNLINLEKLACIDDNFSQNFIKDTSIKLTEIDLNTLQRKKFDIKIYEAINKVKTYNSSDKKYSISNLNSKFFSEKLISQIPVPELVKSANYFTINMWFGQKGYMTPIHFDAADGLLFQIKGKKKVRLISPSQAEYIYRHNHITGGPLNFSQVPSLSVPLNLVHYPLLKHIISTEFILNPGEILYIPSGWWHELWYLDECVSLNYWYGIDFNKGLSWLMLNILACSTYMYSATEQDIYPNLVLDKFVSAIKYKNFEVAKLLMGIYIESIIIESTSDPSLLSFIKNNILRNISIEELISFSNCTQ